MIDFCVCVHDVAAKYGARRSDIAVNVATNRPRRHPMSMRRSIGEDWLREIDIFDVTSIASLDDASGIGRFALLLTLFSHVPFRRVSKSALPDLSNMLPHDASCRKVYGGKCKYG